MNELAAPENIDRMIAAPRAVHGTRPLRRALLVLLAATSLIAADHAMARRGKGNSAPGNPAARAARVPSVPQAAAVAVPVDGIKPIPIPRRHGSKGRPASR